MLVLEMFTIKVTTFLWMTGPTSHELKLERVVFSTSPFSRFFATDYSNLQNSKGLFYFYLSVLTQNNLRSQVLSFSQSFFREKNFRKELSASCSSC